MVRVQIPPFHFGRLQTSNRRQYNAENRFRSSRLEPEPSLGRNAGFEVPPESCIFLKLTEPESATVRL